MCVIQMCVSSSSMHVLFGSIPGGLTERQSYGDTACINLDTCIFVAQAAAEAKITAPERKRKKKKKIQRSHCKTQIQVFFIVIVIIASQKGSSLIADRMLVSMAQAAPEAQTPTPGRQHKAAAHTQMESS